MTILGNTTNAAAWILDGKVIPLPGVGETKDAHDAETSDGSASTDAASVSNIVASGGAADDETFDDVPPPAPTAEVKHFDGVPPSVPIEEEAPRIREQ